MIEDTNNIVTSEKKDDMIYRNMLKKGLIASCEAIKTTKSWMGMLEVLEGVKTLTGTYGKYVPGANCIEQRAQNVYDDIHNPVFNVFTITRVQRAKLEVLIAEMQALANSI